MASGELSLTSNSSQEFDCFPVTSGGSGGSVGGGSGPNGDRSSNASRIPAADSPKDFESAKQQYDQAVIELNSLRVQHSERKCRMDHVMEQLEFYREQYMAAMNQVEQTAQEGSNLRTKYTDISNENVRLQQRNHHLEKKLSRCMETMKHEKEQVPGGAANMCTFVEQCNEWKKKYDSSLLEMDAMRKEMERYKKVCEDLSRDRNSLALEKDGLKQQLTNLIREKGMYHDDIKEMTKVMQSRADELRRMTAQRNAAEHELRTILAERKGVLEENQKLSDDLAATKDELEKQIRDDKKTSYENDTLKLEIETVLRYRDDLAKECGSLREQLEEASQKIDHRDMLMKSRDSTWSKDMLSDSKDKFGRSEQHILDLDAANQEIEKLRKCLERAMSDIDKSVAETEVAKSRRDWAISERAKIVQERDSVKSLCDELRKERDTAISDLLAAIRDSEKIKKQKDEACREVEQIREQLDSQLLNSSRRNIRWSCSPYELELLQKNDTEVVELDMSAATGSDADFGIVLEGGREDSMGRTENGVVVVSVAVDSIAYGKLRPNDCIMQINSLDCKSASKRMVHEALRTCGPTRCNVVVKRQKVNKSHMYAVQLNMAGGNRNHGITLETGVFISKIASDSLAAKEGELFVGDRVLSINSKAMEGVKTAKEAMAHLDDNRTDSLTIISLKQVTQTRDTTHSTSRTKHSKMTNTCTQTENGGLSHSNVDGPRSFSTTQNSKSTSKISEMINKFKGKMHIPGHNNHKGSTVSETDSLCLENDAIEVLDSVLNNENASGKSKDNLFKRSKRPSKKESSSSKEANKNLGTWPRANILLSSTAEGNHSGTIVQPRKKERPALSFFTGPPSSLSKEEKIPPIQKDNYFQPGLINVSSSATSNVTTNVLVQKPSANPNRNSNPIPFHVLCPPPPSVVNRHSIYSTSEIEPTQQLPISSNRSAPVSMPQPTSHTLSRNQKIQGMYHHSHYHPTNPNRLSLNIPTNHNILESNHLYNTLTSSSSRSSHNKSPAIHPEHPQKLISPISSSSANQKNSLDHIPFKNSIDSFLNPKSTMSSMDFKRTSMTSPQQLKDMQHSMKSQNSIDSFLQMPTKSPPSLDIPMKQSNTQVSRDSFDVFGGMRDPHPSRSSRNTSKYPSDSDSLGMLDSMPTPNTGSGLPSASSSYTSTLPSYGAQSRLQSVPPSSRSHRYPIIGGSPMYLHPHPHPIRQSSPLTLPVSQQQTESTVHSNDKLEFEYAIPHHSHGASMDVDMYSGRVKQTLPMRSGGADRDTAYGGGSGYYGHHAYEGGTFPRKKENQRFRIPSNPSVTSKGSGVKNSTGSIEHGSERGSPMPPAFQVEVLSHGANKRNSMPDYCYGQKPSPGDLRRVTIDKSVELGITIACNTGGGIFVSTVADNSIASQVGLQIGDQLLEVCGINMRNATYDLAANVLRQCGNSITMLVQYSPDKFDRNARPPRSSEDDIVSRSGSPTPRNSPRTARAILMGMAIDMSNGPSSGVGTTNKSMIPTSQTTAAHNSLLPPPTTAIKNQKFADSLENQSSSDLSQTGTPNTSSGLYESDPRLITMTTKKNTNLGISLMGGNAVGIYVHDVQPNSLADNAGMRKGDQILEYNGADLRRVTAEQAANEISKPAEKVTIVVQHNLKKFNQIKDEAGDSLYIRVGFDRTGDLGEGELRFTKDDVLYVDTTIFRGVFGQWRAWKLDEYGHRLECGIIPSQMKVEEELRLLSDITDGDGTTRRGSTSARRSFFRRKKHPRSSSRDSKEVASFSNTQLSWFSDSGMLSEEGTIPSYQRVERLDYSVCRPVLIIGPLSDCVADKLSIDFPQLFQRCMMTPMNCSLDTMEKGLDNNIFVDYRKRGSIFECTTVQAIRDICDKNRHCILDVCISAVDRLQRLQIYPIVLLLRFKSAKQIKEIKDSRYSTDKISAKAAKEMYEHTLKLESDYRQYISAVIPAGVNITHMSTQIKAAVDEEQTKVLWVPMSNQ